MMSDTHKIRQGIVAIAAKQICSGIFVSGREASEVFNNSVMVERMIERAVSAAPRGRCEG